MKKYAGILVLAACLSGCSVVAVTDAVVSAAATTVKVGAKAVEVTVDAASSGIKAVSGGSEKELEKASVGNNPPPKISPESGEELKK